MYVAATSFTVVSAGFVCAGGIAKNLQYYGLHSNSSITLGGNADYTALIYAPEADFSLGGGGSSAYDFSGAIITKSLRLNGHFNFHFDESLNPGSIAPWITLQPQSQTVLAGQSVTFTVSAIGGQPINYVWRFNGSNMASTANSTNSLTVTNVNAPNTGSYSVVLSNSFGSQTSSVATLTVLYPPSISAQPVSQAALLGSNVSFAVTAIGTPPLSYQW